MAVARKYVTASSRLQQDKYKSEPFSVTSDGQLFCEACHHEIATKSSTVDNHIASNKHLEGLEKMRASMEGYSQLEDALGEEDTKVPVEVRAFRFRVVRSWLEGAIPLSRLSGGVRNILEEGGRRLGERSTLSRLIPGVRDQELESIKAAIAAGPIAVVHDATLNTTEAFGVVFRFIDSNFTIKQKLVRLALLANPLTGDATAAELGQVILRHMNVDKDVVYGFMRDAVSVNNKAAVHLAAQFPKSVDIKCFCHLLHRCGEKLQTPVLHRFLKAWNSLLSRSPLARAQLKSRISVSPKTCSATRWWSEWEVVNQVCLYWGDVEQFVQQLDSSPQYRDELLDCLRVSRVDLMLEVAATVDVGERLVKATYNLEGDSFLSISTFDTMQEIKHHFELFAQGHHPNTNAIINNLARDVAVKTQMLAKVHSMIEPAAVYFNNQLENEYKESMKFMRAARLCNPNRISSLRTELSCLEQVPFIDGAMVARLSSELPVYISRASDAGDVAVNEWWHSQSNDLPAWSCVARWCALIQPSSASVERVFSLLKHCTTESQEQMLEDYTEAMIMLRYNNRSSS